MKNKLKNNLSNIIFSFFFALVLLLDTKLVYNEEFIGPFTNVSWANFKLIDILWFCLIFVITFLIVKWIIKLYDKQITNNVNKKKLPIFRVSFIVLLLAWLPYLLTYFPGGVYYDTFASIRQVENGLSTLTNHNPILYTLLLKYFITLGEITHVGLKGGIFYFLIVQYISCAAILSYAVKVIYKKPISKWYAYGTLLFFALFSLVPFYVISIWKDTPFSFVLFLYITFLIDKGPSFTESKKDFDFYLALTFFICFLRNNGITIIIGMALILWLLTKNKKLGIANGILLLIILLIQGPIYSYFHLNGSTFIEATAIPFQQITYSLKKGTKLDEKDLKFLNEIIPLETLKATYTPVNFDPIKFHEEFNSYAYSAGKKELIFLWLKLIPKNVKNYIEAYLLQTLGYWDFLRGNDTAYIQKDIWENEYNLKQTDLIEELSGLSLKNILTPRIYFSAASFIWLTFLSIAIVIHKKKYQDLLYYAPCILLWIGIMIGTPIAFSLRYVYVFVLFIPYSVIIPLFPYKTNKSTKTGK